MTLIISFVLQIIDPLPPIDHGEIDYEPFTKNFYEEHEEICSLSAQDVNDLRTKLGLRVRSVFVLRARL